MKGTDRIPFITRAEIARGIAAAVLQWDLHGKVYDIEPNIAHSMDEIAGFISEVSGKKVHFSFSFLLTLMLIID